MCACEGGLVSREGRGTLRLWIRFWVTCRGLVEMASKPLEPVERDLGWHLCVPVQRTSQVTALVLVRIQQVSIIVSPNFMLMVKTWGQGIISSHFLGCSLRAEGKWRLQVANANCGLLGPAEEQLRGQWGVSFLTVLDRRRRMELKLGQMGISGAGFVVSSSSLISALIFSAVAVTLAPNFCHGQH